MKEIYNIPVEQKDKAAVEAEPTVIEKADEIASTLTEDIQALIDNPSAGEAERLEALNLKQETEKVRQGVQDMEALIQEEQKKALAKKFELTNRDKELIKSFDPDLEPIKKIHVGFNDVFRCRHPKYGDVVLKIPSSKEEIDFLKKAQGIPGVAVLLENFGRRAKFRNESVGLLTKYIDGSDLSKIKQGENGWSLEKGTIFHNGQRVTTEKEIIAKLKRTVRTLHDSLGLACFDIRPINVLIDNEGNPHLFDFDIQFGTSRGKELRKWIGEALSYPPELFIEKLLAQPVMVLLELIFEQDLDGLKAWLTTGSFTKNFPGEDFKQFRNDLKEYKKMDLEDTENLFDPKYRCQSLQSYLFKLPPDHFRWR